jgi:hypothetical protein
MRLVILIFDINRLGKGLLQICCSVLDTRRFSDIPILYQRYAGTATLCIVDSVESIFCYKYRANSNPKSKSLQQFYERPVPKQFLYTKIERVPLTFVIGVT